ncbi:MAG: dienelactone hydrolase family protein [Anaerolineaceae bacterium]|nr:dienelactone hydrolase family protein [Anaerolineaceae bacterium]
MPNLNCLLSLLVPLAALLAFAPVSAQEPAGTLDYAGLKRTYTLYVPEGVDSQSDPLPLVIALHPAGSNGAGMARITGLNTLADQEGFLVLYPDGPGGYWDYGWNTPEWDSVPDVRDDPGFIAALLDTVMADYPVDAQRIYALGFSNGGRMVYRLACEMNGRLAAVAAVSGTLTSDVAAICPEEIQVSMLMLHGTADRVIPWNGKPLYLDGEHVGDTFPVLDTLDFWVARSTCPDTAELSQLDISDRISIRHARYSGCIGESGVDFYGMVGGGHEWFTYLGFDTTAVIWDFFTAHPLADDTE